MGNSPTPPGLIERIMQMVDERIARFAQSGFLRNARITEGGITITSGFLRVRNALGTVTHFYVGGVTPRLPDGSLQQGMILRREDGTTAMALYDPIPDPASPDGFKQFLAIYDRTGNNILSDDTSSGVGLARPNLSFNAYLSRSTDWPVVTSTSFTTVYRAKGLKQQPRLYVETWAHAADPASTAEVRVMVNGDQIGSTLVSTAGFVTGLNLGPIEVPGDYRATLSIEIQYRLASGVGDVRCGLGRIEGWQS